MSTEPTNTASRLVPIGPADSPYSVRVYWNPPDKFVRLVREAVSRIPSGCLALIDRLWQPVGPSSPLIILSARSVLVTNDGQIAGVAMTEQGGMWLTFSGPAVNAMPDQIARAMIAHELAHVFVFAALHFDILESSERQAYERALPDHLNLINILEDNADRRAASWGYDVGEARQWVADYLARATR